MTHYRATAPAGYRPEDVPEIRDWLLRDLIDGGTGSALDRYEAFCRQVLHRPAPTTRTVEITGLDSAKLFWVPPAESQVIADAASDDLLPADLTLDLDTLPSLSGFVVFAYPYYGLDSISGERMEVPLRAFRWGPVALPTAYDAEGAGTEDSELVGGIALSAYTFLPETRGSESAVRSFIKAFYGPVGPDLVEPEIKKASEDQLVEEATSGNGFWAPPVWTPLGRSDWEIGQVWSDHRFFHDPQHSDKVSRESVLEDRRLAAALWALMGACEPVHHAPSRAEHRRAARAGRECPPVRIVTWRGPQGQSVASATEPTGRHIDKRVFVKSHYKRQPYGPGRTLRKYILIPSHWRGSEDAPLSTPHETISRIVRK